MVLGRARVGSGLVAHGGHAALVVIVVVLVIVVLVVRRLVNVDRVLDEGIGSGWFDYSRIFIFRYS